MSIRRPIHSLASFSPVRAVITATVLVALAASGLAQAPLQFEALPRMGSPFGPADTLALALGDVDADGDLDLVCGNGNVNSGGQQDRLYLNDGAGRFTDVTATQMPVDNDNTIELALGDVDGDGDLDLVRSGGLYLNDGAGTFTDVTATRLPTSALIAPVLGDVDGDGDLDIVAAGGQPRLYLNDGAGTFADVTVAQVPTGFSSSSVALGDVDGDGDLDAFFGPAFFPFFQAHPTHALYRNDGSGRFTDVTASQMPGANYLTSDTALGDLDGDGDLDLISGQGCVASGGGGCSATRWFRNDGNGTFTLAGVVGSSAQWWVRVEPGDVDGDGDLDLMQTSSNGGGLVNELFLNNGSGAFTDATSRLPSAGWPSAMGSPPPRALGDVDGDRDLDLICGGSGPNLLLLNLQRQLHAPVALRIGQTYALDAYLRYGPPSPFTFALPYLSFAPAATALPPFGTIGIDPVQAIALPPLQIPQPTGVGSLSIGVANDPGLLGTQIYTQALLVPYPHQARLSNVVPDVTVQ